MGGTWARLHSITHSIDVDYRQNTSIRQHLTMTSARVHVRCVRVLVYAASWLGGWLDACWCVAGVHGGYEVTQNCARSGIQYCS